MRSLPRADFVRAAIALPLLVPLPTPAFQSDDKSFDFALPPSWKLDAAPPRGDPSHLFCVRAARSDGVAQLEMTVDADSGPKGGISALGSVDTLGLSLLSSQPQPAKLVSASKVPGSAPFAAGTYELRYAIGASQQRVVKLARAQQRLFKLAVALPAEPSDEVRAEVESILQSWKAFPVNAGCLSQSNRGAVLPGVCY